MATPHANAAAALATIKESGLLGSSAVRSLSGDTKTWAEKLFATADGTASAGFWAVEPGKEHWDYSAYNEAIYVVSGRMIVTEEGHQPVTVAAGDVAVFPKGWKGEWEILEKISKFYVVF